MLDFRRAALRLKGAIVNRLLQYLVRLRVPLSWALGLMALYMAKPALPFFLAGLVVAVLGEGVRIWAAGHLVKGGGLTRSGPYFRTRNPLYLGSCLVGLGFAVAGSRWELLLVLGLLIVGVFLPVMKTEAAELADRYPQAYGEYAESVPLFFPVPGKRAGGAVERRFSWKRVRNNREHVTLIGWAAVVFLLWWKMR